MKINVGTYNIWHGEDFGAHLKGERRIAPENIAEHIIKNDLAICGLEEVDSNNKRSDYVKIPEVITELLEKRTGVKHYFAFASAINDFANPGSRYGNAIISRYPIVNTYSMLTDVGMGVKNEYEPRVFIVAELLVEDKPLTVIVTHFGLKLSERQLAVEQLEMILKKIETPVIFMGDLNNFPGSDIYLRVASLLKDSSEDMNVPLTFPSTGAKYKIDYIFGKGVELSNPRTDDVTYSDHLPLSATLDW